MSREKHGSTRPISTRLRLPLRLVPLAIAAGAGALALLSPASASAGCVTFCGGGTCTDGTPATHADSVWQVIEDLQNATSIAANRKCLSCHGSGGGMGPDHLRMAFEIDVMGDWMKSSYWYPTHSKAESVLYRVFLGLMPPGVWPIQTEEDQHRAVWQRVASWQNRIGDVCSTLAPAQAGTCIWGIDWVTVKENPNDGLVPTTVIGSNGDIQKCNW